MRGARYSGRARLLRRMALGVVNSLEVEDASVTSASLAALQRHVERVAQHEEARRTQRLADAQTKYGIVPPWIAQGGMGAASERAEQVRHRMQMLLGIFAAHGVLPLEYKPVYNVADLLAQHIEELEHEATVKGGARRLLDDHFSKVYKVPASSQATLW